MKSITNTTGMKGRKQIIEVLLENRGIKTKKEREEFFNPRNPEDLKPADVGIDQSEIEKAVIRIKRAIADHEKIIVYGDYDVDGICATTILWETLYSLNGRVLPYIPSRFAEGYGLSEVGVKNLKQETEDCKLLITVDNGIVAHEGVQYALQEGIDVIITDHHEPGETRPDAHVIVHTTKISGSGVAWFLAKSLVSQLATHYSLPNDHLGLAALGTISDVLPLLGFNRAIAMHGLKLLRTTARPGIRMLCFESGIKQEEIDTFHIGFVIGPRLNAMGRVDHALQSLRLLCTKNPTKARELAVTLGKSNRLRQEKTESVLDHVEASHGTTWSDGNLPKLLFVHHESYEEGVIGVAAGRLVEKYHRPTIVVSRGEEFSKASARSVQGVNIVELIRRAGDGLLKAVGGHPMAAGFTVATDKLELLADRLGSLSLEEIKDELLVKNIRVDCEIKLSDVTQELYLEILKFAPFGYGNPEPTFRTKNVFVEDSRLMGKENNHLKLLLSDESGRLFEGVGFRMGELHPKLEVGRPIDIIYSIDENFWNGSKKLQLKLRSIQFS